MTGDKPLTWQDHIRKGVSLAFETAELSVREILSDLLPHHDEQQSQDEGSPAPKSSPHDWAFSRGDMAEHIRERMWVLVLNRRLIGAEHFYAVRTSSDSHVEWVAESELRPVPLNRR